MKPLALLRPLGFSRFAWFRGALGGHWEKLRGRWFWFDGKSTADKLRDDIVYRRGLCGHFK